MMATLSGDSNGRRSGMLVGAFQGQKTTPHRKGRQGCAKDAKEILLIDQVDPALFLPLTPTLSPQAGRGAISTKREDGNRVSQIRSEPFASFAHPQRPLR